MTVSLPRPTSQKGLQTLDRILLLGLALAGLGALIVLLGAPLFTLPAEDALILFQYSRNLAHTGAITFVPLGPHAEGATDFAWMLLLAVAFKARLDPVWVVAGLNVASLFAIACILIRVTGNKPRWLATLAVIGCFCLMPQVSAAALGFSAFPFAVLLVTAGLCFLRERDKLLALSCLLLCLFRPDGVVFAIPLMLSFLVVYPARGRRSLTFALYFALPGMIYFVWRWSYFGHLLPLPFIVKSDTQRFADLVVLRSVSDGISLLLLAIGLAWIVRWVARSLDPRSAAIVISFLLVPTCFYFAMRLDQDIGLRFFVYLPVFSAIFIAMHWKVLGARQTLVLRLGFLLWLMLVSRSWLGFAEEVVFGTLDNRRAIAESLATLPHGTLISTETGTLPYFSGWKTYDPWGLNTAEFSTHLFQPADVGRLAPDAILVFTGSAECVPTGDFNTPYETRTWQHLTRNIVSGASGPNYELWYVPFGSLRSRRRVNQRTWEGRQECWFIARTSPLRPQIEAVLANHYGLPAAEYRAKQPN